MKAVFLNHYPVLPADTGGRMAVSGLALEFAARWNTSLVWTERSPGAPSTFRHGEVELAVHPVHLPWLERKALKLLSKLAPGTDSDFGSLLFGADNRQLITTLEGLLHDGDLLVLCHPYLWYAVRQVMQKRNVHLIYDAHNVEYLLKSEKLAPGFMKDKLIGRLADAEREAINAASLVLTCTEKDTSTLQALSGAASEKFLVGTKGCTPSAFAQKSAADRLTRMALPPRPIAVFVGSDHGPNNEAARWIVDSLAMQCPDWVFHIIGSCCNKIEHHPDNVKPLGAVDDLGAQLAQADIALNPIEQGSGLNIKLLDYLQYGLPVITTPHGARGFEAHAPSGMLISPRAEFAQTITQLQHSPAQYCMLATQGPEVIAQHFDWRVIGDRIAASINSLPPQR